MFAKTAMFNFCKLHNFASFREKKFLKTIQNINNIDSVYTYKKSHKFLRQGRLSPL